MYSLKLIAIISVLDVISCANVLFLNGMPTPSHHMWNRVLVTGLAQQGHNITMVSTDNDKNPSANVHYIFLEATYATIYGNSSSRSSLLLDMADQKGLPGIVGIYDWCQSACDGILNSKGLDVILNYPDNFKFDVVVHDFTCGPCLLPLIHKFNYPPLVAVTAFGNPPYTQSGHKYPAYVPHYITGYPRMMNFPQRLYNTFLYAVDKILNKHIAIPRMERKVRARFNLKYLPAIADLDRKTAIILVNTNNAIDHPEPLPPNMIQVGGLQITEPKELPQELLKFVEGGKNGVVLMSLGTNMKSNMLSKATLVNIIRTFAALPDYNFIWKFESEPHELPGELPQNVFISKFLPQNDILAHPSVKAFVTHSGLLSVQEALWYGKPMVGIPFFCDQWQIIENLILKGIAVKIDFRTLNVDSFKKAILTVSEDPMYSTNAKKISKLFQDTPKKPLDTAIWWIEYVIRNPTADFYRSPTLKLGWFASNSYDIILAILVATHAWLFVLYKAISRVKNALKGPERKKLKSN